MTVFRLHRHEKGYAAIDNKTLQDKRLSFRARGVLGYLLSQHPEFSASSEAIAKDGKEGREAVRSALRELESVGYLEREKAQGADGRWETIVHVYERPGAQETDARKPVLGVTSENGTNPQVAPRPRKPTVGEPGAKDLRRESKTEDVNLAPTGQKVRARDEIWDTLVACFGAAPIEPAFRGAWNRVAKELRGQGATPEEIVVRVARYKATMPTVECTPTALAKHWGRLARDAPASRRVSKIEAARAERRMRNGQAEGRGDRGNREGGVVLGDGTRDVRHLDGGGL